MSINRSRENIKNYENTLKKLEEMAFMKEIIEHRNIAEINKIINLEGNLNSKVEQVSEKSYKRSLEFHPSDRDNL
jgi:hypothetical protein